MTPSISRLFAACLATLLLVVAAVAAAAAGGPTISDDTDALPAATTTSTSTTSTTVPEHEARLAGSARVATAVATERRNTELAAWYEAAHVAEVQRAEAQRVANARAVAAREAARERAAERSLPAQAAPVASQAPVTGGAGWNDPSNPAAWDRLAECESGGNWAANTGNGYYGGLQFALSSWTSAGGTGMPHQASRSTQIAVAQRLWQSGGWAHWPACSSKLGYR
jgi:membrane protein involved in colicin uptake